MDAALKEEDGRAIKVDIRSVGLRDAQRDTAAPHFADRKH